MTKEEKQRINNSRRRLWRGESEIVYITESVGRMVGVGALDHLSPAPMVPSAARNEDPSMFFLVNLSRVGVRDSHGA